MAVSLIGCLQPVCNIQALITSLSDLLHMSQFAKEPEGLFTAGTVGLC